MTIPSPLRVLLDEGASPKEAAAAVISDPAHVEFVYAIVLQRAEFEARGITWSKEEEQRSSLLSSDPPTRAAARRALLADRYWVPSLNEHVPLGAMTVAQHLERATWLRGKAETLIEGAVLHEQWIADLRAAGVDTLHQLDKKSRRRPKDSRSPDDGRPSDPRDAAARANAKPIVAPRSRRGEVVR